MVVCRLDSHEVLPELMSPDVRKWLKGHQVVVGQDEPSGLWYLVVESGEVSFLERPEPLDSPGRQMGRCPQTGQTALYTS